MFTGSNSKKTHERDSQHVDSMPVLYIQPISRPYQKGSLGRLEEMISVKWCSKVAPEPAELI